jgi:hypothetical protein
MLEVRRILPAHGAIFLSSRGQLRCDIAHHKALRNTLKVFR